jgi:hypothetical protein
MKTLRKPAIALAVIMCLLIVAGAAACGTCSSDNSEERPSPDSAETNPPQPSDPTDEPTADKTPGPKDDITPSSPPPSPPPVDLVEYDGVVEHLFFHEVIAYPEQAFNGKRKKKGFDDNMVTVNEYNKILESLYSNNYILVDLNDVWSEYTDENGAVRMKKNTLMLPEGKLPLVLSFDDISFYAYMRGCGFMEKLVIGEDGEIWASGFDPDGKAVISQDLTVVTILDRFVRDHPDFSLGGAKGCIALTGYEGILGYRTNTESTDDSEAFRLNRMQEVARVRPVIQRLKETGWYFATHSYGHINLENASLERVKTDALRWMDEVGSLVGETKLFIYPFGTRLDGGDVFSTGPAFLFYHDLGFRIFASVGYEPFTRIKTDIAAVVLDRMNSDGITLRNSRERFLRFYDAALVFDPMRPAEYGTKW